MAIHDHCLVTRATVKRRGPWISVTGPWHILTYAFKTVAGVKNLKTLDILWPQFLETLATDIRDWSMVYSFI